ncbi:MAG: DUF11 domain-containing protein, partial [Desulfuromonadales bacterium]|nr:DUF11 domain-containing protein [Desulfuromonadales bacterium]
MLSFFWRTRSLLEIAAPRLVFASFRGRNRGLGHLSSIFFALLFSASPAAATLTLTPSTWDIIGLDSNTPAAGPNRFPVGATVCSTAAVTNVEVDFRWESVNSYINLRPGSLGTPGKPLILPSIAAGGCVDAFFEVEVSKTSLAFGTSRRYYITAGGASTPRPRELAVERLVSQSRNAITGMQYGPSLATLQPVGNGGSLNLIVGNTYFIRMQGYTATQGYEQLESFINFPNTVFQIQSVETTYSADTSPLVSSPHPSLYGDACGWQNDPNSPNYRSCSVSGKVGGVTSVTYQVKIISVGNGRETLSSLIHDFSGSSFHYNADFSTTARVANLIDPQAVTIGKNFAPSTTNAGGISTLTFTLTNPGGGPVTGVNFTDTLPSLLSGAPGNMVVASPSGATTSGCGTPVFNPTAGAGAISFSGGTIAGYGTCTVKVNVTA